MKKPSVSLAKLVMIPAVSLMIAAPAQAHEVDLTKLPLGDGKLSTSAQQGMIWACHTDPNAGGAFRDGPWIDQASGTYDFTRKAVVSGKVMWTPDFHMTLEGDTRVFTSNDLPDHPTGTFPIPSGDAALQYDRNPNSIKTQTVTVSLPEFTA